MTTGNELAVIDRIEGHRAVLVFDGGGTTSIDLAFLPDGVGPGSVLRVQRDEKGSLDTNDIALEPEETARRSANVEKILDKLRRRDSGGDIVL